MSKQKRTRILTNRNFPKESNGFEFIEMEEIEGREYLYWRAGETRDGITVEGCFPISVDLVQERFNELGRDYNPSGREVAKVVSDLMVQ